ncbi:ABC transporter ATP-binding protein, partial [Clostridium sp.]|uniref:ABC transporter ATP-binding protein n=2 Tax=Clostridium sp. TaxID=1506 RepID=UPI003FA56ACA
KSIIKVINLKKQYGSNTIIKGISFEVSKGEIFALLGTNGAGKTTTLECIEGIRRYNSGEILVNGKIGVQLQSSTLPEGIRGIESLKLYAKWNKTEVDLDFVNRLGVSEILKKEYKFMSTGQKRRLHLALAMTGNPEIIFLDEPTAGLDVEGRVALHEEIRRLKSIGKTIIMASHDMAEVESLCDTLAILKDGEIAYLGKVNELINNMKRTYRIYMKLSRNFGNDYSNDYIYKGVEKDYHVFECSKIHEGLLEILSLAKRENIEVADVKVETLTLEDSFMNIARGEK